MQLLTGCKLRQTGLQVCCLTRSSQRLLLKSVSALRRYAVLLHTVCAQLLWKSARQDPLQANRRVKMPRHIGGTTIEATAVVQYVWS